jgi:hypothetical protein
LKAASGRIDGQQVERISFEVARDADGLHEAGEKIQPAMMGVEVVSVIDEEPTGHRQDGRRARQAACRHDARGTDDEPVRARAAEMKGEVQPAQRRVAIELLEGIEQCALGARWQDAGRLHGGQRGGPKESPRHEPALVVADDELDFIEGQGVRRRIGEQEVEVEDLLATSRCGQHRGRRHGDPDRVGRDEHGEGDEAGEEHSGTPAKGFGWRGCRHQTWEKTRKCRRGWRISGHRPLRGKRPVNCECAANHP